MSWASKAVERGMVLLDEKAPGWEHHIDLEMLDLDNSCRCVLGQLGPVLAAAEGKTVVPKASLVYVDGVEQAGPDHLYIWTSALGPRTGFTWLVGKWDLADDDRYVRLGFDHSGRYSYADLDEAWIAAIKRRHDLGVFSDS